MNSSKMEITIVPAFQVVSWKVEKFFQLPQQTSSFLESPDFHFSGGNYRMRLYPKVEKSNGKNETQFQVRSLSYESTEREVCCRMGLRRTEPDGDESYDYLQLTCRSFAGCIYERSKIENNRDKYVPDGSLTMVCDMWLDSRAKSSAHGGEEQEFQGGNASFLSRWSPTKMELTTESPCTRVQLTVCKFLELPRKVVDSLSSPQFRFAGDTFCFRFSPNAYTTDTDLQLVKLTSNFTERPVFYRVGHGKIACPAYPSSSRSLVGTTGLCISFSELEEQRKKYVLNGTLYVVLFLHLGAESGARAGIFEAAQERDELTDIPKLQSDYGQLLQKGTGSDACFVVRGKEFRVHRNVLRARSPVFEAMFGHDTAEKESGRVVIDDLDPYSFRRFLEYVYTGDVEAGLSDDSAIGLYVAADKYDVSTLKSKCVDHMRENLSVDYFCDIVTLALRHHEKDLLAEAIRFFKNNKQNIIVTAGWQQFMRDNPKGANELLI